MASNLPQIKFNVSPAIRDEFHKRVPKNQRSAWLRAAIIEKLERDHDVALIDDTPQHGYNSRISKRDED